MRVKNVWAGLAVALSLASVSRADTITIEYQDGKPSVLPEYVLKCKAAAYEKIEAQAKAYGVTVDMRTLRLTGAEEGMAAKYLWWAVDVTGVNGRTDLFPAGKPAVLQKMTQQPPFSACF